MSTAQSNYIVMGPEMADKADPSQEMCSCFWTVEIDVSL